MKKLLTALLLLPAIYGLTQAPSTINGPHPVAPDSSATLYYNAQGESAAIFNGRVFYGYPPSMKGIPYYPVDGWGTGSVLYDGTWFQQVTLRYDAFMDELIVLHPGTTSIRLLTERVQAFEVHGIRFVHLGADSNGVLKDGFYQQLVDGPASVFVLRQRKIEENIVDLTVERKFISTDQYYLRKNGRFYHIDRHRALTALLKDGPQNVSSHLKRQQLKFKFDKEKTMVVATQFYNQSLN